MKIKKYILSLPHRLFHKWDKWEPEIEIKGSRYIRGQAKNCKQCGRIDVKILEAYDSK